MKKTLDFKKVGGRMNKISSWYQPQTEALRNFGVNISREAVNKYALEHFGRIPETIAERDAVIVDKCRTEIQEKVAEE